MLSEELYHSQTHAMLGSHNIDIFGLSEINSRLSNVILYKTDDVAGVTMCGIVKNIYAIGMGMLHGCEAGDNARSCFATMALNEMSVFTDDTILSYSGVGDFLTTCYSVRSRNYTYGYNMALGLSIDNIMSEGANNIDHVLEYSSVDLPIVSIIKSCLKARDVEPLQSFLKSYHAV
jgi:glycerol-3-phosphate dehydrogenase